MDEINEFLKSLYQDEEINSVDEKVDYVSDLIKFYLKQYIGMPLTEKNLIDLKKAYEKDFSELLGKNCKFNISVINNNDLNIKVTY